MSGRHAAIVWQGTARPKRLPFDDPGDAVACAVDYLLAGYQVRLTNDTVAWYKDNADAPLRRLVTRYAS